MSYFVVIFGLLLLIFLHEMGHFLAARAVGIHAPKFYVGFPPAVFKIRRGRTEYGVGALMLGGYVKLAGMFRPDPEDIAWRLEPLFDRLREEIEDDVDSRRVAEAASSIGNARTPEQLVTRLELAHAVVTEVTGDAPKQLDRAVENAREDVDPHAYWRAALWKRMTVIFAGPLVNVLLAFAVLLVSIVLFTPRVQGDVVIASIANDSPAQEAGLLAGDEIVRWNGELFDDNSYFLTVERSQGEPVDLTIRRNERQFERTVHPAAIDGRQRLGLNGFVIENPRETGDRLDVPIAFAAERTVQQMWRITRGSLDAIANVFDSERRRELGTVVGIVQIAPDVAEAGQIPRFLALISLVLAIFNLLPILPLDGGHIAFGLLEKLRRGRPLPRQVFERASIIGLAGILMLFVVGLQNDLTR